MMLAFRPIVARLACSGGRALFQAFERGMRRSLFRFLFCAPLAAGHACAGDPDFDLELFLMIGTRLCRKTIFRRRLPAPLQKLLQCRLTVRVRDTFAPLFQRKLEEHPPQDLSRVASRPPSR